jgi:hypothetical protein
MLSHWRERAFKGPLGLCRNGKPMNSQERRMIFNLRITNLARRFWIERRSELCGKLGDDGMRLAACRGGCRACQHLWRKDPLTNVLRSKASVICRANHSAVGWRMTSNHSSCRRPWPRTRNASRPSRNTGFSWLIRRIRSRSPRSIFGRPALFRDFQRHSALKPARCHRRMVSG